MSKICERFFKFKIVNQSPKYIPPKESLHTTFCLRTFCLLTFLTLCLRTFPVLSINPLKFEFVKVKTVHIHLKILVLCIN